MRRDRRDVRADARGEVERDRFRRQPLDAAVGAGPVAYDLVPLVLGVLEAAEGQALAAADLHDQAVLDVEVRGGGGARRRHEDETSPLAQPMVVARQVRLDLVEAGVDHRGVVRVLFDVQQRQPRAVLVEVADDVTGSVQHATGWPSLRGQQRLVCRVVDHRVPRQRVRQRGDPLEREQRMVLQAVANLDRLATPERLHEPRPVQPHQRVRWCVSLLPWQRHGITSWFRAPCHAAPGRLATPDCEASSRMLSPG
jgi:hypothetical protein